VTAEVEAGLLDSAGMAEAERLGEGDRN